MAPQKIKFFLIYGYGVELLIAGLGLIALLSNEWLGTVAKFIDNSAGSWTMLFGVMLAGAMAARLVFFSLNTGDFSAWLEWKKLGGVVAGVFLYNLLLFLAVTVISVVLIYVKGTWLSYIGVLLIILGLINSITFSVFVFGLSRVQAFFNFEFKKETEAEKKK
jgi:hypothetical protein